VGVFDILATADGVWFGSDTTTFAGQQHPRIAFFPLAGGTAIPSTATQSLPASVYLGGNATANPDELVQRSFTGTTSGTTTTVPSPGIAWSSARGAVYIGNTVYTGWSDGNLYGRTYDGSTFGPAVAVNGMDQIVSLSAFHTDVPNMTAMFFDGGRLYFTLNGSSSLFYRYFTPSSKVIGAVRYTASNSSGAAFSTAGGMFLSNGKLFIADRNSGNLASVNFSNGVASGSATTISGPGIDGKSWKGRALFVAPAPH
jgi:outer membrane protein assembly factor BamB